VFLFHNIGETSKELVTLANLLAQNEYDVIACDMINHGRSSTDKKFLLKEYPAIAWDFIQYTKTLELGSSKYTLLGVGFGALIVDNLYAKNQYFYYTEKKILFVVLNKL
jgi:alpha-beta hydrolase superfamily lysophospholipase